MLPIKNNNSLFNIHNEYLQLLGKIEEAEGEITEEIDQALQFTEQRLREEGINVAQMIMMLDLWVGNLDLEISRLEGIRRRANKGGEMLKNRLAAAMNEFGIERLVHDTVTISFRKSEAVEITDERLLPPEYLIQGPTYPGKTRIKEAIKAGKEVPGAELVQRQNLQIK